MMMIAGDDDGDDGKNVDDEYYGCLMHVIYHHAPIERTSRYSIEGRCEGLQHVVVLDIQRVGTPG